MAKALKTPILFEDVFDVVEVDPQGKKFDKVSRYQCHSDLFEMDLLLDINTELFPLEKGQKFSLALAWTLNLDATASSENYDASFPTISKRSTLMDQFEYVMYGKVFKYKDSQAQGQLRVEVFVSFGGLLMQLSGDPSKLESFEVDNSVYLLMRKL